MKVSAEYRKRSTASGTRVRLHSPGVVRSGTVVLATGTEPNESGLANLTVDFGLWSPLGVGNLVFLDYNNNGNYDDSEGVEGLFYVWTPAQLTDVLGTEDAAWQEADDLLLTEAATR